MEVWEGVLVEDLSQEEVFPAVAFPEAEGSVGSFPFRSFFSGDLLEDQVVFFSFWLSSTSFIKHGALSVAGGKEGG